MAAELFPQGAGDSTLNRIPNGPTELLRGLVAAAAVLVMMAAVAGCGGSSKPSGSSKQSSSSSSSSSSQSNSSSKSGSTTHGSTTTTSTSTAPKVTPVAEMGRNVTQKTHAKGTLKVKPGDTVQLRTTAPVGKPGSKPAKVAVTLDSGPSHSLKVKASANGHSATVRLVSSGPGKVSLLQARYACHVPPVATFCPFKHVSTHGTQTSIELAPRTAPPVIITAMVGPVSGIVKPRAQRKTTVVSPYTVSQMARTVIRPSKAKHASKPPSLPFGPTTTAKPGNVVVLRNHLMGTPGAPQPMTIVIDQGPGHELKASASVPGGKPAVTTIKSGSKKPIVLMVPTYVCFLPPFLTVCPAVKATTKNHKYTLKFMATPRTPAIVIVRIHAG